MARPIEPTPTLSGENLDRFCRGLKNRKYSEEKAIMLKEAREIHRELNKNRKAFPTILRP